MDSLLLISASDRLRYTARESSGFKVAVELGELLDGAVDVEVANVVPGEPLKVRWRVALGLRGTDSQAFDVRLLVDGRVVHERGGIPASQATIGGGAYVKVGDLNYQSETVVIGDPAIAQFLYKIGKKQLIAEVRAAGSKGAPEFTGAARFRVVAESFDSSWWE